MIFAETMTSGFEQPRSYRFAPDSDAEKSIIIETAAALAKREHAIVSSAGLTALRKSIQAGGIFHIDTPAYVAFGQVCGNFEQGRNTKGVQQQPFETLIHPPVIGHDGLLRNVDEEGAWLTTDQVAAVGGPWGVIDRIGADIVAFEIALERDDDSRPLRALYDLEHIAYGTATKDGDFAPIFTELHTNHPVCTTPRTAEVLALRQAIVVAPDAITPKPHVL